MTADQASLPFIGQEHTLAMASSQAVMVHGCRHALTLRDVTGSRRLTHKQPGDACVQVARANVRLVFVGVPFPHTFGYKAGVLASLLSGAHMIA